jgi:hypothetical protein
MGFDMLKTTTSIINGSQITGPINGVSIGATTASTGVFTSVNTTTGNFVPNTAGNGINFTANTPAAGMTSQLLKWYEEGTWTPGVQIGGSSTGITGTFTGTYTRVGRTVVVLASIVFTSKGASVGALVFNGLPFAVGTTTNIVPITLEAYSGWVGLTIGGGLTGHLYGNTIYPKKQTATNVDDILNTNLTDTTNMYLSATYFV